MDTRPKLLRPFVGPHRDLAAADSYHSHYRTWSDTSRVDGASVTTSVYCERVGLPPAFVGKVDRLEFGLKLSEGCLAVTGRSMPDSVFPQRDMGRAEISLRVEIPNSRGFLIIGEDRVKNRRDYLQIYRGKNGGFVASSKFVTDNVSLAASRETGTMLSPKGVTFQPLQLQLNEAFSIRALHESRRYEPYSYDYTNLTARYGGEYYLEGTIVIPSGPISCAARAPHSRIATFLTAGLNHVVVKQRYRAAKEPDYVIPFILPIARCAATKPEKAIEVTPPATQKKSSSKVTGGRVTKLEPNTNEAVAAVQQVGDDRFRMLELD